jgi:hypothetical protein
MTTELKTLKDLDMPDGYHIQTEDLKAEAIKWFKYAIKHHRNAYLAFMDFFNISEEDLA